MHCKPISTGKESGERLLRMPLMAFGASQVFIVAAQIDMHVFSPSGSFDEGADHVQWMSWAASGQQ